MKPIYLDIGNSSFKLAEYKNGRWVIVFKDTLDRDKELLNALKGAGEVRELIVSSVRKEFEELFDEKLSSIKVRKLTVNEIPERFLDYNSPDTLGVDRFLSCLGAASLTENSVIVIDAGSACTIDFMTQEKKFQGGVIMPGLAVFRAVMAEALPELPQVKESLPRQWPGKSTKECIQWGLYGGFISAIEAFIKKYQADNKNTEVYITGGDAILIKNLIGKKYDIQFREYLLFDGMREFAKRWA
jgi:type III pantothenate kinase